MGIMLDRNKLHFLKESTPLPLEGTGEKHQQKKIYHI
jgi:hypothetical protein